MTIKGKGGEQFCKIISLSQEIARIFPKYPNVDSVWFLSIFTCLTIWHVCVFGRKLQIELQVVPQTFASACLTTPIGIHFPSFCVSQESKLSTMMMGKFFLFCFTLPVAALQWCHSCIHICSNSYAYTRNSRKWMSQWYSERRIFL